VPERFIDDLGIARSKPAVATLGKFFQRNRCERSNIRLGRELQQSTPTLMRELANVGACIQQEFSFSYLRR
jgi:hypothetical protein